MRNILESDGSSRREAEEFGGVGRSEVITINEDGRSERDLVGSHGGVLRVDRLLDENVVVGGEVFDGDSNGVQDHHETGGSRFQVLANFLLEASDGDVGGGSGDSEVGNEAGDGAGRDSTPFEGDNGVQSKEQEA